jgi:hypothetical protein
MLERIGTKKIMDCYDNKQHECTLYAYLIRLTGDTYNNRAIIGKEDFHWDDMNKAWYANVDSEEKINRLYKEFKGTGIKFDLRPIWGITD